MRRRRAHSAIGATLIGLGVLLTAPGSVASQDLVRSGISADKPLSYHLSALSGNSFFSRSGGIWVRHEGMWAFRPTSRPDWQAYFRCQAGYGCGGLGWTPNRFGSWLPFGFAGWDLVPSFLADGCGSPASECPVPGPGISSGISGSSARDTCSGRTNPPPTSEPRLPPLSGMVAGRPRPVIIVLARVATSGRQLPISARQTSPDHSSTPYGPLLSFRRVPTEMIASRPDGRFHRDHRSIR
jgi:hypothetical protein